MIKAKSVLDLIGGTPIVRINRLSDSQGAELWVKLENLNPGGSIKDRIALRIVEDYEREGVLEPGGTLVEATSGNTGMGLAMVAAIKGYHTIFVMPDKVSGEKRRLLRAMGSEVVICPTAVNADDPASYYSVARRLSEETPGAVLANQYYNPSNLNVHYDITGPEIWEQTEGKIDAFVASMGTGGTISGIARYLKEQNPKIKVWAADPFGSILKTYKETGKLSTGYPYLVEGIGEDIIPGNLEIDLVDEVVNVNDQDSFHMSRQLARKEGLFVGGSAGTILKLAVDVASEMQPSQMVVAIVPDTGDRYLSKHFSDEWMQDKGMLSRERASLELLRQLKDQALSGIVSVSADQQVRQALEQMSTHNVSQLPVFDGEQNIGSVRESNLLAAVLSNSTLLDEPVKSVMEQPFPSLDESATVAQSIPLLLKHQGVVLTRDKHLVGFLTRHDVINFPESR